MAVRMTPPISFSLNPALDETALAARFASAGRLQVADFLSTDTATALHALLRTRNDWMQVLNSEQRTIELSRPAREAMTGEQRAALDTAVYAAARFGFQYRYETVRVPDDDAARAASDDPLAQFARWLSSGPPRDLLRSIVGEPAIAFADMQGTAYGPGDFLTGHDDAVAGKGRYAAYVLSLSPVWRIEWGGLLLFHPTAHAPTEAFAPQYNSLNLFRVPQLHSVTEVTRAAAYRRYSITGWLRGR